MSDPKWFVFSGMKLLARITKGGIEVPRLRESNKTTTIFSHYKRFENPAGNGELRDLNSGPTPSASSGDHPHDDLYYGAVVDPDREETVVEEISSIVTHSYTIARLQEENGAGLTEEVPENGGFAFLQMRSLVGCMDEATFMAIARAKQLTDWDATMRRCPRCTSPLDSVSGEHAKSCAGCNLHFYPPVSPAVIVAIFKGDAILLAHNERFPQGLYSLVAGFVEPGENLEECVRREVKEEVGINLKNIRYFGSQPWPFPHSLMIGFSADYASGTIRPDGVEILDADWFTPDTLPDLPLKGSISRRIIETYLTNGPF